MTKRKTFGLLATALMGLALMAEPAAAATATATAPAAPQSQGLHGNNPPQTEGSSSRSRRRGSERPAPRQSPEAIKAAAEGVLGTAGITSCQVTEAVSPGIVPTGTVYEVACATGPGYILIGATPPTAIDCFELAGTAAISRERDPTADTGLQCSLPANNNSLAVIGGWAREAGVTCTIDQAVASGKNGANMVYEVGCDGADGYWVERGANGWTARDCFEVMSARGVCRFTTPAEQNATIQAKLAGTDAAGCTVTQSKLMGHNANGRFYEVKCATDGEGYIARVSTEGVTQQIYPCATAQPIGGGCTLTPVPAPAPAAAPATGGRA
ncbi:hypothetical protein [Brevundimonas sp. GCM10030266]|uniref:hypothetical protein n=1 Tax=Brevundimonas sp. GCM10030266 TaxID=3273386 RepID=UPI0036225778